VRLQVSGIVVRCSPYDTPQSTCGGGPPARQFRENEIQRIAEGGR
jgi:hypothetical protein